MDTSLSWIKDYVPDLDVSAEEYTDAMTLSGTKVEGYKKLDKNLEKIVVGEIISIEKHPDADKLIVCQVNVGNEDLIQIVTGAKNVNVGDKVPVVLDGGKVAGGHDKKALPEDGIKIKKGKLRGIESFGMMCSIEELGSDRNFYPLAPEEGIYIFPKDILHINSNDKQCAYDYIVLMRPFIEVMEKLELKEKSKIHIDMYISDIPWDDSFKELLIGRKEKYADQRRFIYFFGYEKLKNRI